MDENDCDNKTWDVVFMEGHLKKISKKVIVSYVSKDRANIEFSSNLRSEKTNLGVSRA